MSARFICKGFDVMFILTDGRKIFAPPNAGLLHDPNGAALPTSYGLVATFRPCRRDPGLVEYRGAPMDYLGGDYDASVECIVLPRGEWRHVIDADGEPARIDWIYYMRNGTRASGPFKHQFGVRRWQAFWRKGELPYLYKAGSAYLLDLGEGAIWDYRGVVYP